MELTISISLDPEIKKYLEWHNIKVEELFLAAILTLDDLDSFWISNDSQRTFRIDVSRNLYEILKTRSDQLEYPLTFYLESLMNEFLYKFFFKTEYHTVQ
ncbi:MAG: hypothetical protein SFU98_14320 [Leptospiraceae bacterium]|nr:hypothetical protein [Leptospiraceae bacterium]